jgi:pyruvate ferredoxin oxidoreductase gamma subunit
LLALAASVYGGRYAQAFPSFGPERRGAPVLGFTRIDDEVIRDHSEVAECDCVIVLDETLVSVADVFKGLKPDGTMVLNSVRPEKALRKEAGFAGLKNLTALDATGIALKVLRSPIVNTVMLGAAIAATGVIGIADAEKAVEELMPSLAESNKRAMRAAYETVKGGNP